MKIHANSFTFFQFPPSLDVSPLFEADADADALICDNHTLLEDRRLKPIGPLELACTGFVEVTEDALHHHLVFNGEACAWIAHGLTKKILPAAAVNEALAEKLKAIEEREGRKPGGRTRKRIKEELVNEMLPRAFSRTVRTDALLFPKRGLIAVATASRKTAEGVVSEIRAALGSFPALPLNAEVAPRAVLTGWVAGDVMPDGLALGYEAKLEDPAGGGSVKLKDQDLVGEEINAHLEVGKQATTLALANGDRSTFTFSEDLALRKFRIGEAVMDEFNADEHDDAATFQAGVMTIVAAELVQVFGVMSEAFKFSSAEG